MTALSIGLGLGRGIPVLTGDIPLGPPVQPPPPPTPTAPPPVLRRLPDDTIEIEVPGAAAALTLGGTGLYDGAHVIVAADVAAGPVYLVPPPGPTTATAPGDVLSARPGLVIHRAGLAATITRRWLRDGTAIAGATGTSHVVTSADRGAVLTVTETATNADGTRSATSAPVAIPAAPTVATAPTIVGASNPPKVGETLTAGDGTWNGDTPMAFTRQWTRDGANVNSGGPTYALGESDLGAVMGLTVTASNGASPDGVASATAAVTAAAVANVMPFLDPSIDIGSGFARNPDGSITTVGGVTSRYTVRFPLQPGTTYVITTAISSGGTTPQVAYDVRNAVDPFTIPNAVFERPASPQSRTVQFTTPANLPPSVAIRFAVVGTTSRVTVHSSTTVKVA